jgi:hypothetical protein
MILEDEFGDDVLLEFHDDATMELSVISGDVSTPGTYVGGVVFNQENARRLVRRVTKWLEETAQEVSP